MYHRNDVDLSVLVDIISNVAGMMILLACLAILIKQRDEAKTETEVRRTKPISFPLAYVPTKRSLTLCLKNKRIYELPERQLLEEVSKRTEKGETIQHLSLEHEGVAARILLTPTDTGFRFEYRLLPEGGVKTDERAKLVNKLHQILTAFPPDRFFYVIHTWPDCFAEFREIREYLHEHQVEVGWVPSQSSDRRPDIVYSIGEYDKNLSTIKAQ